MFATIIAIKDVTKASLQMFIAVFPSMEKQPRFQ